MLALTPAMRLQNNIPKCLARVCVGLKTPPKLKTIFVDHPQTVQLDATPNMAFRKRNVGISHSILGSGSASSLVIAPSASPAPLPGVRPSPIDGRPTTSTGTPSFDGILAGHAGFALGSSILVEESGTTDFAGALLRYYAAEGVVQGHKVHDIGVGEQWGRELPGLVGVSGSGTDNDGSGEEKKERMKIAWRYERLGEFGSGISGSRGVWDESLVYISMQNSIQQF